MIGCRECKPKYDAKNCGGKPYYEPKDIKFCTFQNMWLIEHIYRGDLGGEYWPQSDVSDIKPSGIARHAKFETPSAVKAEVELRLKRTGVDGDLLEREIELGRELGDLSYRAKTALFYISGGRKRREYAQWKSDKEYEKNLRKAGH